MAVSPATSDAADETPAGSGGGDAAADGQIGANGGDTTLAAGAGLSASVSATLAAAASTGAATSTAAPPAFRRSPREYVAPPEDQVEIQEPPAAPAPPSTSLMDLLVPVLLGALISAGAALGFSRYMTAGGSGASTGYLLLTLAPVLAAIFPTLYSFQRQRRQYKRLSANRVEDYRAYLAELRPQLQALADRQRRASVIPNPSIDGAEGCRVRAERRDHRLWERTPKDVDFLDLRLGEGTAPATFSVHLPNARSLDRRRDPLVAEAQALAHEFAEVSDVAITLPLARVGMAGVVGGRADLQRTVRALLMQLATHHSPTEVKVVLTYPEAERAEWEWARWLPHTWNDDRARRFVAEIPSAGSAAAARGLLTERYDVLKQRRLQRQANRDDALPNALPVYVFVFADASILTGADAAALGPLQELLFGEGAGVGAFGLVLADRRDAVPQGCGAVVEVRSGGRLHLVGPPARDVGFTPDAADAGTAEWFARVLAPLRVQRLDSSGEIQYVVPFLDMLGAKQVEDLNPLAHWQASEPFLSLAAPIGVRAGGEVLHLDAHERAHGPHGLEAGATGSGKSELLQTLIASIAIHYHPHEVAFVLIDYKGGGMANAFRDLPHQIGIITNLGGNLTTRALSALRAELQRRQRLFAEANVTNIDRYLRLQRQGRVPAPLPHLFLIADEFAELAQNQPEFMAELISAVRIGRSLGIHLLLGTQKPAGVVNDQIWGNTRFRLSLRVERPEDSMEVLKRPDAAALRSPGRCYFQVGMNEVFELFQSAYAGAPYAPGGSVAAGAAEISLVALDGTRRRLSKSEPAAPSEGEMGPSQLEAVVSFLRDTAAQAGIERLPEFWLPPLPTEITLDEVRSRLPGGVGGWDGQQWQPVDRWLRPVVGLVDEPARQAQAPLPLDLGREGHLAIFGAPGSGKTTLLHTLIASLVRDHSPDDLWLYALDFGGRTLKLYETLPHVGAVILPDEAERVERLFRFLLDELDRRKALLSSVGAGTLQAYRADPAHAGDAPPAIVVVLDGIADFAEGYGDYVDLLTRLAREGASYGIHLVATASAVGAMSFRLAGNFALKVALELNDPGDYVGVVGRTGGLTPAPGVPGRGLVSTTPPLEFQTALPASGASSVAQTAALRAMVAEMVQAWYGAQARAINVLPEVAPLADVTPPAATWAPSFDPSPVAPLAVEAQTLEPWGTSLAAGPHFLVTAPPASGKSTLLQAWVLALAERVAPDRLTLFLNGIGSNTFLPFGVLPHTAAIVEDEPHLEECLRRISAALDERSAAVDAARRAAGGFLDEAAIAGVLSQYPALLLAIDDFDQFAATVGDGLKGTLETLMRRGRGLGFHLLVAGSPTDLGGYDALTRALKNLQTGFAIGSSDMDVVNLLNFRLPPGQGGKPLPPGRGYFAKRGRFTMVQIATPHAGSLALREWIDAIAQRPTETRAERVPSPSAAAPDGATPAGTSVTLPA